MARLKNMTKIYEWMYFDCWGMFVTFTMLVFLYILEIHCVIWEIKFHLYARGGRFRCKCR